MLDPQRLRREPDQIAAALATRGFTLDQARLAELEARRKAVQTETEQLQADRQWRGRGMHGQFDRRPQS